MMIFVVLSIYHSWILLLFWSSFEVNWNLSLWHLGLSHKLLKWANSRKTKESGRSKIHEWSWGWLK
jgi:hypothetical protein